MSSLIFVNFTGISSNVSSLTNPFVVVSFKTLSYKLTEQILSLVFHSSMSFREVGYPVISIPLTSTVFVIYFSNCKISVSVISFVQVAPSWPYSKLLQLTYLYDNLWNFSYKLDSLVPKLYWRTLMVQGCWSKNRWTAIIFDHWFNNYR